MSLGLFAAAAKSEEKRMFSQATLSLLAQLGVPSSKQAKERKSVGLVPGGTAKKSVGCLLMVTWAQARF